ncbi:MAG: response regulator [Desulfobacterales bacterium]|nr:response regulator [Desulfobacterales bacterium]
MTDQTSTKASILIVDDNHLNLTVLFECLNESGFKILIAEDGESAITRADFAKPDLILLDIMMPGIDGFETCRRLKEKETTKNIPIIFMTAMTDPVDKIRGFGMGAVDYVTKPFHQEEVIARITTHLTIQRQKNELEEALFKIRTLNGLLPICASCKKIRNDKGYWEQVETYIENHTDVRFSHGVCPDCSRRLYPELYNGTDKI